MKIVFLNFYGGYVPRGIETFVHELANRLAKKHETVVFQSGPALPKSSYRTIVVDSGADWQRINELRHLSTLLFLDFDWHSLLRRFYLDYWSRAQAVFAWRSLSQLSKSDVVITAGSGWVSLFSRLWCWRHGAKLIIAGQSGPGWDDRVSLLCHPDTFVAVTSHQANWANRNSIGVKVTTIPNGVDLSRFSPSILPVKINLPRPLFLCAAALEAGKHVDWTIKAVAGLKKGSLLVLGSGPLKESLEKLAAEVLTGRFQISSVSHDKIPGYYAGADVVTMIPPLTESFGIVFLEAMACGKPVVTSDDPPRREIVGGAGLFVEFGNLASYTTALRQAMNKKWGDLPRQQAAKFSWDKIAQKYEKLLKSL